MFRWNDKMYIVIYIIAAALPYVPILGTLPGPTEFRGARTFAPRNLESCLGIPRKRDKLSFLSRNLIFPQRNRHKPALNLASGWCQSYKFIESHRLRPIIDAACLSKLVPCPYIYTTHTLVSWYAGTCCRLHHGCTVLCKLTDTVIRWCTALKMQWCSCLC